MKTNGNDSFEEKPESAKESVSRLVSDVKEKGRTLLHDGLESAKQAFEDQAEHLRERASQIGDKTVDEILEDTKHFIRKNPLQSMGLALGAGLLIGWIINSD